MRTANDAIHIVPDSRNQPAEFTETRFPLLVEKLALRMELGGAACGGRARYENTIGTGSIAAPSSRRPG